MNVQGSWEPDFFVADWRVRPALSQLERGDLVIEVEARSMAVLACLARHAPNVVSKQRLIREVWGESFVSEEVLSHAIWELRKAFGDEARNPRYIQTLAKKGYRLLAEVSYRVAPERLAPGSRIAVEASPVQATVFDSRATGRGTVTVAVAQEGAAAQTALRVRFNRFVFEDLRQKGRPDYLRGQGLLFSAVIPSVLDLTGPVPDFDATLDLPDAEVPDLTVYDALLPKEGGLWIVSGRGRARLHLEASTATNRTRGTALLTSDAARFRFQNLEMAGRLALRAPLASPDLGNRRFDLKGTRLELADVSYRNVEGKEETEPTGWWARAELSGGSIVWGAPLSLRGEGKVDMKNSGPLLTLFSERSRLLRWFDDALNVENLKAQGSVRLGNGAVEVESLQASGGPLEIRTRMDFSKTRRWGDLFVRYGRLAAGVELRDGQRSIKLVHPLDWYESQRGVWKLPPAP